MVDWVGVMDGRPAKGTHSVGAPDMVDWVGVMDGRPAKGTHSVILQT